MKVPFFSSLLIIGALAACQGLPLLKGNQPDPQPGDVLFSDDFSSEATGWGTWNADGSAVAYHSGGLRVLVGQPNLSFWSTPGKTYDDAVIEVDAQKMSGPDNNSFGIICRYQDNDNMYGFIISSDQYAGIFRKSAGEYTILSDNSMLSYQPQIKVNKVNHIKAACVGTGLTLWVNDLRIATWQDQTFSTGQVGVIVSSLSDAGVDVLFDNFQVTQP